MKKLLCMAIALLLLYTGFGAQAEQSMWEFDTDDYILTGYHGEGGAVIVPESIDGCSVDILGMDLFNADAALTSLTLSSAVKQVEENVASFCDNLTELVLPEGVQIIEDNSFICNPALTEVVIPASVRYIGLSCFGSSESLSKVTFLGECPVFAGNAFDWIADDAVIYVPDDQYELYAAALYEAECYSTILPSGANAVAYDRTIDPVLFDFDPSTGTITGFTGYAVCVEVPAEIDGVPVRAIGENAFAEHRYMCMLSLPEGLETIGASAFESCRTLLHIDFPSTLKVIESRAFFAGYKGYALELPSVETIGDEAFAQCIRISDPVYLPDGLRSIGDSAFYFDAWMSEVYIPASVESIGDRAFGESAVNYIAFEGIVLPEIAANAFENCWYLSDIDLHSEATKQDAAQMQAMVDAQGLSCYVWRMQNPQVDYFADGLDVYENGVLTAYTGTQTHVRPWDTYEDVDVTAIGEGVFKGSQTIAYFSVPYNDVFTTIGAEAFAESTLRTIDLFDSVTTIGDGAFRSCAFLADVTLPDSVTAIGSYAFSNCASIEELVIPENVTSVGAGALSGCTNLKKLTVLCDPNVLPADFLEGCNAEMEIYAAQTASGEALKHLSAIAGRAWNNPVTRIGEAPYTVQAMPYEPLPGADFWYDTEFARLDDYQGYELNLILPREIDGMQLTMVGGGVMGRAVVYDNFEAELPVVSVVIPETYTEIASYAFANCETLETVICYAPIEMLDDLTFANCTSLREVVFVNGVHSIGANVFDNCPNLQTVYFGPYVENVSEYAFVDANWEELWSLEQSITDPAQMPDVDALLAAVKCDPMPMPEPEPIAEPAPAVPVGEEGKPFFGTWSGTEMDMGGEIMKLSDWEMHMTLILLEDGRAIMSDKEISDLSGLDEEYVPGWYVENGVAYSDGCTMTILEDGRLVMDEDGFKIYFERSETQIDIPSVPYTPDDTGSEPEITPAPAVSMYAGMTEAKYVCVNADVDTYTIDASMLGGEYSLIFHDDGTADFVVVGAAMPSMPWEMLANGNYQIDYFGTKMEIVWTENGFDMNYFDTMLMHFVLAD